MWALAAQGQDIGVATDALEAALGIGGLHMVNLSARIAQRGNGVAHEELHPIDATAHD